MEKIETLLKVQTGDYATPKKLNRSQYPIPEYILSEIEAGNITCEMLDALSGKVPVFKYKTCITIHGTFAFNGPVMPRIGGYQNIIRNQNGSLEVRYNAIDLAKKKRISDVLRACEADLKFQIDSRGTQFEMFKEVKDRDQYEATLKRYRDLAAKIEAIHFYGQTQIWLAQLPWGGKALVFTLIADAIPDHSVKAFMTTLTGKTETEILAAVEKAKEAKAKIDQEWADRKAADKVRIDALQAKMTEMQNAISEYPSFDIKGPHIGIRVTRVNHGFGVAYKMIQIGKSAGFGRVDYRYAYTASLDAESLAKAVWKDAIKAEKIEVEKYRSLVNFVVPSGATIGK